MQEKTEQPTPKKIRDARKKGQVAHSKEFVSTALMIALYVYFFTFAYNILSVLQEMVALPAQFYHLPFGEALKKTFEGIYDKTVGLLLPFLFIVILVAIFANLAHVGPLFAPEAVKLDLKKISPIAGFKRIFAMKSLVELIKSIFKIVFLSLLIYWVIRTNVYDLVKLPHCGMSCMLPVLGKLMFELAIVSVIAFLIVAVLDLVYQRYNHTKELKMSKDEVKREYKDIEGDPEIQQERKRVHRDILEGGMIDQIKKSSVIVTNPTHYAIGIRYNDKLQNLPTVTLKTRNRMAKRVKAIAAAENIPVFENVPLARALYADSEIGNYIPSELIEPVAEVLKWVISLKEEDEF